ncbi:MAG: hypothetical protein GC185_04830 [Alphaproteobacteria bacterium]|nr:hypothetical protein [Alphaproteobacteria bacterium]
MDDEQEDEPFMTQPPATDAFAQTQQPSPIALEAQQQFSAHIAQTGLEGYLEVLGAHVAAWHKTTLSLAAAADDKAVNFLQGTAEEYLTEDIRARLDEVRLGGTSRDIAAAYHDMRPDVPLSDKSATVVAGMNVWSPKKQEAGQLFVLAQQLPQEQREQAFEALRTSAALVTQEMGAMQAVENELLLLSRGNGNVPDIEISKLARNVEYHASVRDDWKVLAAQAEKTMHVSPAPDAAATAAPGGTQKPAAKTTVNPSSPGLG